MSHSRLSVFRACPRKYFFSYEMSRVPIRKTKALEVGSAWHKAMEVYWKDGREAAIKWLISQVDVLDEVDTAKLVALLRYYNPPIEQYEVVSVEEQFEEAIRVPGHQRSLRGYRFGGWRDMVLRNRATGLLFLLERKTTSDEIAGWGSFWQRLALDFQSSVYLLYGKFAGLLYDVVRKPMLRPSKQDESEAFRLKIPVIDAYLDRVIKVIAGDVGSFYQFRELMQTPEELAETAADLAAWAQNLHVCHKTGRFPRNTNSCRGLYGFCEYLDVCSGASRIDDDSLFVARVPR